MSAWGEPQMPLEGGPTRRARRRHPLTGLFVGLALIGGIAWLWYWVFSPLFENPEDWVKRERAFRQVVREVLAGAEQHDPDVPQLPPWPGQLTDAQARLVACADAQVARNPRFSQTYQKMDYPWGDVGAHLVSSPDLVVRCLRAVGLDLQQLVHHDRVKTPSRYPLHIWGRPRPDTSIDHRRLPILHVFVKTFADAHPTAADTPERLAAFLPGDLVFWAPNPGAAIPTMVGLVTDRRDAKGVPRVVTVVPADKRPTDHHRLTDWPIIGHFRVQPDPLLERFLEQNPDARLQPRPAPTPR